MQKSYCRSKIMSNIITRLCVFLYVFFFPILAFAFNPIYHVGNDKKYEEVKVEINSPLKGKKILFLGSSVTQGLTSENFSFVELLIKKHGINAIKEAVSGTTLVDKDNQSYIQRLKKYSSKDNFDAVVCQLSTNDVFQNSPLYANNSVGKFDTQSVEGAINYIVAYVKKNWDCPILFYTNPPLEVKNDYYKNMVDILYKVASEKNFKIIDIYNSKEFNSLNPYDKGLYMYDHIHPTKAGYIQWLPEFEKQLYLVFGK